jgi:hypothetical protein
MIKESSETISKESTQYGETATLFNFYVLKDPRDLQIKYVGRTVNPENRFRNHIYEAKTNNRNKRERWILKLLRMNLKPIMQIIYIKICTLEEAISIEKMLVKKLSRRFDLKNEPDNYLGAVLTGTPVFQYTLDGVLTGEFSNSNQASLRTGVKDSNILRCCKNENGYGTKTAGGFFWSFVRYDKYPYDYVKEWRSLSGKPVVQLQLDGTTVQVYSSAVNAEKGTGINRKKISAACLGRQKTAGGFKWKFYNKI